MRVKQWKQNGITTKLVDLFLNLNLLNPRTKYKAWLELSINLCTLHSFFCETKNSSVHQKKWSFEAWKNFEESVNDIVRINKEWQSLILYIFPHLLVVGGKNFNCQWKSQFDLQSQPVLLVFLKRLVYLILLALIAYFIIYILSQ